MGINASRSTKTPIMTLFARATGIITGKYYEKITGKPDFMPPKQRKESINPKDSIEMRVL